MKYLIIFITLDGVSAAGAEVTPFFVLNAVNKVILGRIFLTSRIRNKYEDERLAVSN